MTFWHVLRQHFHLKRWLNRWRYTKLIHHLEKSMGGKTMRDQRLQQLFHLSCRLLDEHPSSLNALEERLKRRQTNLSREDEAWIAAVMLHLKETHIMGDLHQARSIRRHYRDSGDAFIREQLRAADIDPICIASVMAELDSETIRAEAFALAQWRKLKSEDRQKKEQAVVTVLQGAHFSLKVAQAAAKSASAHRSPNKKVSSMKN